MYPDKYSMHMINPFRRPPLLLVVFPALITWEGIKYVGHMSKRFIVRRWAKDLAINIRLFRDEMSPPPPVSNPPGCRNIAGLGGRQFHPKSISWNELLWQSQSPGIRAWRSNQTVIRETIFFEYFGPLEAWCDDNCNSPYYLWTDDSGIHCVLTDPVDFLLWSMTWDGTMPTMKELSGH